MFGSNFEEHFGLPGLPWRNIDPQGGLYPGLDPSGQSSQPTFPGMEQGQRVPSLGAPGVPAPGGVPAGGSLGASANPSVAALQTANPLAAANTGPAVSADASSPVLGPQQADPWAPPQRLPGAVGRWAAGGAGAPAPPLNGPGSVGGAPLSGV